MRKAVFSKRNKLLSALGLPLRYHEPKIDKIVFRPIDTARKKNVLISPAKQEKWVNSVLDSFKKEDFITSKAIVMSRPTDDSAMHLASAFMLKARQYGYSARAINIGFFRKLDQELLLDKTDVLILYSLNVKSSEWKLDMARDILKRADSSMVILVCTAPTYGDRALGVIDFNYEYLNFPFDAYIELEEAYA